MDAALASGKGVVRGAAARSGGGSRVGFRLSPQETSVARLRRFASAEPFHDGHEVRALEFTNCNCAYGCPCQFNALPTHGHCRATISFQIETGHFGDTPLDWLKVVGQYKWPGPIHLGHGEAAFVIDAHADAAQRDALLRILSGKDTDPGTNIFAVFATTLDKMHDPVFADIDFEIDIEKRRARVAVPGYVDARGEPILNPVTGKEHRVRIDNPNGFEFRITEAGRGWSRTTAPIPMDFGDSYGHFCHLNLSQSGVID